MSIVVLLVAIVAGWIAGAVTVALVVGRSFQAGHDATRLVVRPPAAPTPSAPVPVARRS
jgi:hypothetical protein